MEVETSDAVTYTIAADLDTLTTSGDPKHGGSAKPDQGAFVEVLDKHDTVLHRARFDQLPITIGNHYRCHYILDSEDTRAQSVSLVHKEGALVVRDLVANHRFWAPGGMTTEWRVDPDRAFILAGERIRIRTRDYLPSRASSGTSAVQWLSGWTVLLAVLAAVGVTVLQNWAADIDGDRISKYIMGVLAMFGVVSVWAGVWALVSRLNGKSSHFLAHFSLASLAVAAISAVEFALDSASFSLGLTTASKYGYVVIAACMGILVWCHTRYIVRARLGAAASTAIAISLAVFVAQALTYFNLRGSIESSLTMNEMRPPAWRISEGVTLDQFLGESESLKERAEASKSEKPEGLDVGNYGE